MKFRWIIPPLACLALAACDVKQDRFGRTETPSTVQEPLTIKEVSFHVRMQLPESELVAQAQRRGLAIDDDNAQKALAAINASPSLIAQLTAKEVLLTAAERRLWQKRLATRQASNAVDQYFADSYLDQRKAGLNQSLATQNRARTQQQIAELTTKMAKIRVEQRKEQYSSNSNSPYQRRQAEIDQLGREISALQAR